LLTLLILPVVAMGGAFSVCADHHDIVYVGNNNNGSYLHVHEGDDHHGEQPHEHQCSQVESEVLPFVQVQVPVFDLVLAESAKMPDFRWCLSRMHSMVALALARASYWEPPPTRTAPLLI